MASALDAVNVSQLDRRAAVVIEACRSDSRALLLAAACDEDAAIEVR
jgi:hypothetical protein